MTLPCFNCITLPICRIRYKKFFEIYKGTYDQNCKYNVNTTLLRAVANLVPTCELITVYIKDAPPDKILNEDNIRAVHDYMVNWNETYSLR